MQNLNEIFTTLHKAGIKLHPEKHECMTDSVWYLGYRIDRHGLQPVEANVEANVNTTDPINVDELCSFLSLIMYYVKFLP